jgi:hypothetical protein
MSECEPPTPDMDAAAGASGYGPWRKGRRCGGPSDAPAVSGVPMVCAIVKRRRASTVLAASSTSQETRTRRSLTSLASPRTLAKVRAHGCRRHARGIC